MFFKTKGAGGGGGGRGGVVVPGLPLSVWLAGATCRWNAAGTPAPAKLHPCLWLKAVFLFQIACFCFIIERIWRRGDQDYVVRLGIRGGGK